MILLETDPNPLTDGRNRMAYPSDDDIVDYPESTCVKKTSNMIDLAQHLRFSNNETVLSSTNSNDKTIHQILMIRQIHMLIKTIHHVRMHH